MTEPLDLPHSAICFGDARDHWWSPSQVDRVAFELELTRHVFHLFAATKR